MTELAVAGGEFEAKSLLKLFNENKENFTPKMHLKRF